MRTFLKKNWGICLGLVAYSLLFIIYLLERKWFFAVAWLTLACSHGLRLYQNYKNK